MNKEEWYKLFVFIVGLLISIVIVSNINNAIIEKRTKENAGIISECKCKMEEKNE